MFLFKNDTGGLFCDLGFRALITTKKNFFFFFFKATLHSYMISILEFPWLVLIVFFYFVFLGAGSCLEVLGAGKPLLVVINDKLMDNHQLELAKQLQADGHLLYCTCRYGLCGFIYTHTH